jgi:uncharacterized protein YhdP
LSGRIKVEMKDGTITAAKGTEALRLFGILNAEAITRRLKLDFSDVYPIPHPKKGFFEM